MGLHRANGLGMEQHLSFAGEYYKPSAVQSHLRGQCKFDFCLENGRRVRKDPSKAARYSR
jgi:TPR repeat protein